MAEKKDDEKVAVVMAYNSIKTQAGEKRSFPKEQADSLVERGLAYYAD